MSFSDKNANALIIEQVDYGTKNIMNQERGKIATACILRMHFALKHHIKFLFLVF